MARNKRLPEVSKERYALKKIGENGTTSVTVTLAGYSERMGSSSTTVWPNWKNSFRSGALLPFACSFPKEVYPRCPASPGISYFFFTSGGKEKKSLVFE